jgi:type II secretory pathway component PulK
MVVTTLMFLAVLVTDISYGARVRLLAATHERDEAKALGLAQTGVNIYRLILTANRQLKDSGFAQQLSSFGINAGDALWQMVPFINTGLLRMLSGSSNGQIDEDQLAEVAQTGQLDEETVEKSREAKGSRFGNRNFLDFEGDFSAEVRGEDCRINVNSFATRSPETLVQDTPTGQQVYGLLSGEANEQFLRERNLERWDLVNALADWVDADNTVSSGRGGYEDDATNSLPSPYLSKNTRFDTHQEIRLVPGWQDDVFERFASQLTIYGSGKVNVNCADDDVLKGLMKAYATRALTEDELERILTDLRAYMAMATFANGKAFVDWVKTNGNFEPRGDMASAISTSATVFTVRSTGQVGDATVTITAVVDYTSSNEGTVLYWRVD